MFQVEFVQNEFNIRVAELNYITKLINTLLLGTTRERSQPSTGALHRERKRRNILPF